jgi:hypothetical protein
VEERVPAEPGSQRGLALLLIVVAALVVISAAIAVTVIFVTGTPTAQAPPPAVPVPGAGHTRCTGYLMVSIQSDDEVTRIAEALRADPQALKIFTETRAEAYARFKETFKDQPDLVDTVPPEAVPGSVSLVPAGPVDLDRWAAEIRARFPTAEKVTVLDTANASPQIKAFLERTPPPPCPSSGSR